MNRSCQPMTILVAYLISLSPIRPSSLSEEYETIFRRFWLNCEIRAVHQIESKCLFQFVSSISILFSPSRLTQSSSAFRILTKNIAVTKYSQNSIQSIIFLTGGCGNFNKLRSEIRRIVRYFVLHKIFRIKVI